MGSSATLLKPERVHQISYRGVANLMHLPYVSVLDIDSTRSELLFLDIVPKTQEPDRKETGRAFESLIAAAARIFGRQRSGFMFIDSSLIP